MSYTPTTWETGDVITAEKLNNMESGIADIASGRSDYGIVVTFENNPDGTDDSWTMQTLQTVEELVTVYNNGGLLINNDYALIQINDPVDETKYTMECWMLSYPYPGDINPVFQINYYCSQEAELDGHFQFGGRVYIVVFDRDPGYLKQKIEQNVAKRPDCTLQTTKTIGRVGGKIKNKVEIIK